MLPLARFTAYFLHVNMAKHNNRIQTIENNREINHENGVHLSLKCARLKLELEIGKRFCRASRQLPSRALGFRVSGRNSAIQVKGKADSVGLRE